MTSATHSLECDPVEIEGGGASARGIGGGGHASGAASRHLTEEAMLSTPRRREKKVAPNGESSTSAPYNKYTSSGFLYYNIREDTSMDISSKVAASFVNTPARRSKRMSRTHTAPTNDKMIPLYRPRQRDATTRSVLKHHSSLLPPGAIAQPVKVLFVRGYYLDSMGARGKNDRNCYDDAVFVCSPDGVQAFNANADPSRHRRGIATVASDQSIRYRPGMHGYRRRNGPYPAFRQDSNCAVLRDGRSDPDVGMFHVNLHRGGVTTTSSAGCLTIPARQWDEFYDHVMSLLKKYDQKTFRVVLLEYAGGDAPVGEETPPTLESGAEVPQGIKDVVVKKASFSLADLRGLMKYWPQVGLLGIIAVVVIYAWRSLMDKEPATRKSAFFSLTYWFNVFSAISGSIMEFSTLLPAKWLPWLLVANILGNLLLRHKTKTRIGSDS